MAQYLPIVVMLILASLFAGLSFAASRLLGPRKPTLAKSAPYECGIVPSRGPAQRFPVRFYLVAMIFIIFDIEVVFLYPWAVIYRQLDTFGLAEMIVFAVLVLVSFLYLVSNGALDWGPGIRRGGGAQVTTARTSTSTIRRVPRPGGGPTLTEATPASPPAPERHETPVPVGAGAPGGAPGAGATASS